MKYERNDLNVHVSRVGDHIESINYQEFFQAIANELAEANRLKKIEISHQYFLTKLDHEGFDYNKEELDKLLEDKA